MRIHQDNFNNLVEGAHEAPTHQHYTRRLAEARGLYHRHNLSRFPNIELPTHMNEQEWNDWTEENEQMLDDEEFGDEGDEGDAEQKEEDPQGAGLHIGGSLFHSEYKKKLNNNFTHHSGDVVAHVRKHDGRHIGYSHTHKGGFLSFLIDAGINIGSAIGDAAGGDPMEFGRYAIPKV